MGWAPSPLLSVFSVRVFGPPAFPLFPKGFICQTRKVVLLLQARAGDWLPNVSLSLAAGCALSSFWGLELVCVCLYACARAGEPPTMLQVTVCPGEATVGGGGEVPDGVYKVAH